MQRTIPSHAAEFLHSRIDYERTISIPYGLRTFQLERMRRLLSELGNPQDRLRAIHVAGTKGKGSTAAMIVAALAAAGHRVGLFTSPHLERFEERIAINGHPCPADALAALVERVRPVVQRMDQVAERGDGPTYFEIITALAFCRFADEQVDCAALEVGLGGRLDSTNVCRPIVSVITSISFDHTQLLGDTLEAIAGEKAGIIKPETPVISGVVQPGPREVIAAMAERQSAPLRRLGHDFRFKYRPPERLDIAAAQGRIDFQDLMPGSLGSIADLAIGLVGPHQAANAAVALATLGEMRRQGWRIPDQAAREGLARVHWPGRLEVVHRSPTVVLDAAHNVASIEALLTTLDQSFAARRRWLIFATSRDKDVRGMLSLLLPQFDGVLLSRYATNPRGQPVEELAAVARELAAQLPIGGPGARVASVDAFPDLAAAWAAASERLGRDDLLVITGSFFTAAEMLTAIRERPLR